jgi:hypothetical protein
MSSIYNLSADGDNEKGSTHQETRPVEEVPEEPVQEGTVTRTSVPPELEEMIMRHYENHLEKVHLFLKYIHSNQLGNKLNFYTLSRYLDKVYRRPRASDLSIEHHLSDSDS